MSKVANSRFSHQSMLISLEISTTQNIDVFDTMSILLSLHFLMMFVNCFNVLNDTSAM